MIAEMNLLLDLTIILLLYLPFSAKFHCIVDTVTVNRIQINQQHVGHSEASKGKHQTCSSG